MQNSPILKIESGLSTQSPDAKDSPTLVKNSESGIRETIWWAATWFENLLWYNL